MSHQSPIQRGLVLHALYEQYPMSLTTVALERRVEVFYRADPRALARDLAYLEERLLIRSEKHEVGGRTFGTVQITAAGVNVVEGTTTDPGVELSQG